MSLHSLHHTTTTTATAITLHYNYNYSCTTPHYIQQLWVRWPLQPLQPLQKIQLQPPFGLSVDSLCHQCSTTTNLSPIGFIFLRLPLPPCAVLLVYSSKAVLEQVSSCTGRQTLLNYPGNSAARKDITNQYGRPSWPLHNIAEME